MAITIDKIPLPKLYKSVSEEALPDTHGGEVFNMQYNELGNMVKRPGLLDWVDTGESARIDGLYWVDEWRNLLIVANGNIFKVTASDGTNSNVTSDTLQVGARVSFTDNDTYVSMANGGKIVQLQETGTTAFVTDGNAPTSVTHVDTLTRRLLALEADSQRFWFSDIGDPTAWTSISWGLAEQRADNLQALHVSGQTIMLFGKKTIEPWLNDGVSPFTPSMSEVTREGVFAPYSVALKKGIPIMLDEERKFSVPSGGGLQTISGAINGELRGLASVGDCIGTVMDFGNRSFYLGTLPTEDRTYAYNFETDTWAKWGAWSSNDVKYTEFKGRHYAYCKDWGFGVVGDASTGKVYKISNDYYDDAGTAIRAGFRTGWINRGVYNKKRCYEVKIRCKRAAGDTSGNEPVFQIRWRNEENGPWNNWVQRSLGKMGEGNTLAATLRPMGNYRTRQYEMYCSENVPFEIIDIEEKYEILAN